ncbi:MAG: (2Fe-2S) ferredoxin domain-containing protein [Firmicutes bacterium]|nr:(2Fe-2S) ferredoxin domain-containing protein [Bacillota bacterium]
MRQNGINGLAKPTKQESQPPHQNVTQMNSTEDTKTIDVYVCMGTGCYLRGSYHVLNKFIEMARHLNLEQYINVKGTFCLEHCDSGVSIKANDEIVTGVNDANAEQIFKTHVAMKVDPPWASR